MTWNSALTKCGGSTALILRAVVRKVIDRRAPAPDDVEALLIAAAVAATLVLAGGGGAEAAGRYANARFGYVVEIPKGFSGIAEADNGDGGKARSEVGDAELAAWGANLLDETFAADIASRIASDASGGWSISYRAAKARRASWSGSKGGRIAYSHAIAVCRDRAAYVRIEYDRAVAKAFHSVVKRLARSLKAAADCA